MFTYLTVTGATTLSTPTFDDPADLEDLAAERDDQDNDPAGEDAGAEQPRPVPRFYVGRVETGPVPYVGRLLVSRFPRGVLLIEGTRRRAWLLDLDVAGGVYRCRNEDGTAVDDAGRWRAAEGPDFEVRAFDPEFDGDEPPGPGPQCDEPGCDDDGDVVA